MNPNSTEGFIPVDHLNTGNLKTNEYTIAAAYVTAIHTGDPVKMTGTGRNIEAAAAGEEIVGVFAGVRYELNDGSVEYSSYNGKYQASEVVSATALVYDDPDLVFELAADGASGENVTGNNCDFVLGGDASAAKKFNKGIAQVDSTTFATTADVLRVVGFKRTEGNDPASDYARLLVAINPAFHQLKTATGV